MLEETYIHDEIVKLLPEMWLEKELDLDSRDDNAMTSLSLAAANGHKESCEAATRERDRP